MDLMDAKGVTWKSYNQKYVPLNQTSLNQWGTTCNREHDDDPNDNCNYAR